MITQFYTGQKGRYTVGSEVGRGGEGAVYEVKEDAAWVLKIYNERLDRDKTLKLQHMLTLQDADLNKLAAWPQDIVRDNANEICGFVMRKLEGYVPLHMLFSPMDRKRLFPDKGYNFLVHVARNLAIAFHKIHAAGIVVGDVNEGNILVNATGIISLIDCDSFQVKNGNTYHFCEVGILRYTPPELLNRGTFNDVVRTPDTDSFSLAVLIFQLLFLGRHPFTGTNLTKEDIDEEKAIKTMEFAYSLKRSNKKLNPAKNSLDMHSFTPGIIDLFHRSFETLDTRPAPGDWVQELDTFGKELMVCSRSGLHYYPKQLAQCPWCAFIDRSGIVFFLDDTYLKSASVLNDIDRFIHGYKMEQIVPQKLTASPVTGAVKPNPIDRQFYNTKKAHRARMVVGLFITLLPSLINPGLVLIAVLFVLVYNMYSPEKKKLNTELARRNTVLRTIHAEADATAARYKNPPELDKYNKAQNKLGGIISNYKGLQGEFNNMRRQIDEKYYNQQYHEYLQRFEIKQHTIPSFGATKKGLLYLNGIVNAADITKLNRMKIPSIGPKNIQVLIDWQRQIGSAFTYIPNHKAINTDLALAMNDINNRRQKYEEEIKTEYKQLQYLKLGVTNAFATIERHHEALIKDAQQAEADMKAFRKFM